MKSFASTLISLALTVLLACCTKRPLAPTFIERTTGMRLVLIPAGTFAMGSPPGEIGHQDAEGLHQVTISRPFYLGAREVTQREWLTVMGSNPSHFVTGGLGLPVEQVNWYEVHEFLRRLNQQGEGRFRLPTESEWEYACRAGTQTPYAFGNTLSTADANYDGRYPLPGQRAGSFRGAPIPAGSLRANAWGLHDMHGNVWEWCEDDYCRYPAGASTDPVGKCGSPLKVIRGGSWYFNADSARSALRYTHRPEDRGFSLGFRIVRDVER